MNLAEFDPNQIEDEGSRQAIMYLLNLVERQQAELERLRQENEGLREENNRLKGQSKKPKYKAEAVSDDEREGKEGEEYSSEKERKGAREGRGRKKRRKNKDIKIDREETLKVEQEQLPADAEFKGHEEVIVQDIKVETDNVRFRKEKWYSPSEGKTYLAEMPMGYEGQFGPRLKAWVVVFAFALNVTEGKIENFLETTGISISTGQIAAIIKQEMGRLEQEKEAVYEAGLRSSDWQQIDDTGAKVNGENCYTQVVCNPYYTAYFTGKGKDRLTVLEVLWGGKELQFCLDEMAWVYLNECGLPQKYQAVLATWPQAQLFSRTEFEERLQEELPQLGPKQYKWVLEGAGIAAYHRQESWPVIERLVCDDAGQFKRIVSEQALCWVHEGRHYQKLSPVVGYHRQQLAAFRSEFWDYYRQLWAYRQQPTVAEKKRLSQEFDTLFATQTGYEALDERIAKTKAKKDELLRVLDHPELPLHNNEAELGARQRKPKENISYGPRTTTGAKGWDTGLTLVATARKLGVNIFAYLHDRVGQLHQMPSLADLITQKAAKDQAKSVAQPQAP